MEMVDMPSDTRSTFVSIDHEVQWIHAKWIVYRQIFAGDQQQIDILNRTAPFFFRIIQQAMLEDIVLAMARLLDPAETMGNQNRSLMQLLHQLDDERFAELQKELRDDLLQLEEASQVFKVWRNKKLAHTDLAMELRVSDNPLPGISRALVETALEALRKLMNRVNGYFMDSSTAYEHFSTITGGDRLLELLEKGVKEEDAERKELLDEIERHRRIEDSA